VLVLNFEAAVKEKQRKGRMSETWMQEQ